MAETPQQCAWAMIREQVAFAAIGDISADIDSTFPPRVHDVAGHLFIPLLALHVTGAVKHAVLDRSGTAMRMIRPAPGGQ